jgi:hypothetical protein
MLRGSCFEGSAHRGFGCFKWGPHLYGSFGVMAVGVTALSVSRSWRLTASLSWCRSCWSGPRSLDWVERGVRCAVGVLGAFGSLVLVLFVHRRLAGFGALVSLVPFDVFGAEVRGVWGSCRVWGLVFERWGSVALVHGPHGARLGGGMRPRELPSRFGLKWKGDA